MSDDQFRDLMWESTREIGYLAPRRDEWESFGRSLFYVQGDLSEAGQVTRLERKLAELEDDRRPANRLFFLSISPEFYETAIRNIGATGLSRGDSGWRRVVIEKPFGWDLASAAALDREVHQVFSEEQVYRIDHYLGKETVQNLLVVRFANTIFEPVWNRNYVDNVQITVAESIPVGGRAGYYDQSGVVRDMVQNHLLQLLTMVAMEAPSAMDAESLRNKKVDVLRAIRRWTPEEAVQNTVHGQYAGYLDEPGVPEDSTTATYVALRMHIDNWRWRGVPFYLRTGKALAGKVSEVVVQFQAPPHLMFSPDPNREISPNALALCIQPDEGAHLILESKVPDQGMAMQSVHMEFHYESAFSGQDIPEAYERLLQDALEGDPSLFIRSDQIQEAWRLMDPLLRAHGASGIGRPHAYEPGSWGPAAADDLLAQDGHRWLQICGVH